MLGAAIWFWRAKGRKSNLAENEEDEIPEMEDQDEALAKRKWYLGGRWRSEVETKSKPQELDSRTVTVIPGPPVELDASNGVQLAH